MTKIKSATVINGVEFCDFCGLVRGEYRHYGLTFCQHCWEAYLERIVVEMEDLGCEAMDDPEY